MHFNNTIGDVSELFASVSDEKSHWELAQKVAKNIGGSALNIAVTSRAGEISWGRSGMSQLWLKRYEEKQYYVADPFIEALVSGRSHIKTDSGVLLAQAGSCKSSFSLNHELREFGYNSLIGNTFGSSSTGERTMIVHCSDQWIRDIEGAFDPTEIRVIHAIIAANFGKEKVREDEGVLTLGRRALTQREKDILTWLACGLRNDEIAYKAGIAEVTVRKHLLSIRFKLRASTRENAIAIAMRDKLIAL